MISNDLNMPIVISDEINEDFTLMIPYDSGLTNSDYLRILVQVLKENNLSINSYDKFFLITRDEDENNVKRVLNFIKLKNIDFDTLKPIFNTANNLNPSYIAVDKTIVFNATPKEYKRISTLIATLDKKPKQLKLRVTIIDTNLDKLKDYGFQLKGLATFTDTHNYFFNLLAYPFTVTSEVSETKSKQLHSFIKFMDSNSISKLITSPTISLFDNKKSKFNLVKNIPYISGTTTTENNNTTSITSYSYKDVGLKLSVLPKIYDNNVYLDLEFTNESIIDNSDSKPITSKSSITQTISIQKGKIFVLTGFNQKQNYSNIDSTPFLSDVPFLGWLFKLDNNTSNTSNVTIFLEIIDNDNVYIKNDVVHIDLPKFNEINEDKLTNEQKHQQRLNDIFGVNNLKD
jgi:general secretion pathway protein D